MTTSDEALLESTKKILESTKKIVEGQKSALIARGENFNIFSILDLETREDGTHSAFIGELLNPKGSHLRGTVFLELFVKTIGYDGNFDFQSASLIKEFYIGRVDLEKKTGGRIDLFLEDKTGNSISIENKIYAFDQEQQIERYVNYNTSRNTVYYLTLDGTDPGEFSAGNLVNGQDFYCLSYGKDIIDWLEKCKNEAIQNSFLKASIRQYISLIKKLTLQLPEDEMQEKILNLISKDYKAASFISKNIEEAEKRAACELFKRIEDRLKEKVGDKWIVTSPDKGSENGISIKLKGQSDYWIRLKSDGTLHRNNIYFGVFSDKESDYKFSDKYETLFSELNLKKEGDWQFWKYCERMMFGENADDRANLFNSNKVTGMVDLCVELVMELKDAIENV